MQLHNNFWGTASGCAVAWNLLTALPLTAESGIEYPQCAMTPTQQLAQKRAQAVALIEERAPEPLQQPLIDLLRPAIALNVEPCADAVMPVGASKFGGAPDVPAAFEWPLWNGRPLGFLAQINLREVAPFDVENVLPPSGLLAFFYEVEDPDTTDVSTPGSWRACYLQGDNLKRASVQRDTGFHAARMSFSAGWSSVSTFEIPPPIEDGDWRFEMVVSPCAPVQRRLYQGYQMLGYGSPIIGDAVWYAEVRALEGSSGVVSPTVRASVGAAETQKWILLFQLDSDDELNTLWGDVGTLFFMIRKSDLARADFDKTWMELQFT